MQLNLEMFLNDMPESIAHYARQVPLTWWPYIVNGVFSVMALLCAWTAYYGIRRALGHERFRGSWYSHEQFEALKQEIYTGVREGRLPDSEMMALLDRHVYGRDGTQLRKLSGTDWL